MTKTTLTVSRIDQDEDGRFTLRLASHAPLPEAITLGDGNITIYDKSTREVVLAEVLDFNDAWYDGGEPTFVWCEFVGAWPMPSHPADDPRHLTSDRF